MFKRDLELKMRIQASLECPFACDIFIQFSISKLLLPAFAKLFYMFVVFFCFSRFCAEKWDGSNLVLGTMYAYDIFAAMPCCAERLKVSEQKCISSFLLEILRNQNTVSRLHSPALWKHLFIPFTRS